MSDDLKKYIRTIKDFPKKGITFRDITTLLKDPVALKKTSTMLFDFAKNKTITKVVGIESRGFMFAIALAEKLDVGFVPCRKPGKLPADTEKITYELEYGADSLEIHKDAIQKGDKILIHDDLLATGGTALAACKLVEKLGGRIVQVSFVIELTFLKGRSKLKDYDVRALIDYDSE
jgi:adenine phosphoribosyltransferase